MEASYSNSKVSAAATAKHAFPSPIELEVASSLLLLSNFTTPPALERGDLEKNSSHKERKKKKMKFKLKMKKKNKEVDVEKKSSPKFTISKSRLSSPASSTVTAENHGDQRAKLIAVVSKFPEMTRFKVARKRRSKSFSISDFQKSSCSEKPETSTAGSATSSVSSGSNSATSSASNLINIEKKPGSYLLFAPAKKRPLLGSAHMRGRADAILKILSSHGCASEVKIRDLLGDSPSTSKALRILLNLEQVKRRGAGGRTDPYIYMIA